METPMKTWNAELPPAADSPCMEKYITPSSVFLDLETTGFSSARNQIYMIGYAFQTDRKMCITQLFAETPSDKSSAHFWNFPPNINKSFPFMERDLTYLS